MSEELGLLPANELLTLLASKTISSVELLEHLLRRNDALGSQLNAIITFDTDNALATARAIDNARANEESLGKLAGLPMTVKDALAVKGVRSTGGAVELKNHVPNKDADVVSNVRNAGAVVFGKTNLPRWSGDIQATNEIFGTTNNPWDLSRGPGGSSGGASAALAAGLTALEIGTDIGGSIRLPAHFAGVCGHKPSYGVVSQRGYIDHVSYGHGDADVNVVGPLARCVDDLELLFDVLIEPSARPDQPMRLTLPVPRSDARKMRVAAWINDENCPTSIGVAEVLEAAVSAIRADGISVDETARPDVKFEDVHTVGLPLISAATSPGRTDEEFEALQEIVKNKSSEDPTLVMRASASTVAHRDWLLLAETRDKNRRKWWNFFQSWDVLLAPVAITAAFPHQIEGNLYTRTLDVDGGERPYADLIVWTSQFGYVYLPSTVVPVGKTKEGLPIGIQVVGPYLGDRTTIEFAKYIEQLLGGYKVPPLARIK
ncbi:MAG: amidase [Candidatus Poriferisodalaceae bacterium]|jgi:amidase|tara:strand:+ start:4306 stop:5769 length:1464 start_codon:yes stop_codon:yes gene_type:complete